MRGGGWRSDRAHCRPAGTGTRSGATSGATTPAPAGPSTSGTAAGRTIDPPRDVGSADAAGDAADPRTGARRCAGVDPRPPPVDATRSRRRDVDGRRSRSPTGPRRRTCRPTGDRDPRRASPDRRIARGRGWRSRSRASRIGVALGLVLTTGGGGSPPRASHRRAPGSHRTRSRPPAYRDIADRHATRTQLVERAPRVPGPGPRPHRPLPGR